MRVSLLKKVLCDSSSLQKLKEEIAPEVAHVAKLSKEKGRSLPIVVNEDDEFVLGLNELRVLCDFFANSQLDDKELSYISDAIQLSDSIVYGDDIISDYVFEMSDPEINGLFTNKRAKEILCEIDNKL